ncbi:DUF4817 domain-containing protein, partial [Staphylococcus aureus]|nr:DUF4817 domain-containing protein [Staphylococcus aureus]
MNCRYNFIRMLLSKSDLIDMIFILGESDRNCLLASRIYSQRYPDRRHPDERSFRKVLGRFVETGSINYSKHERIKPATNEDNELQVLLAVEEDPSRSQRQIGEIVDISERSVQRVLKKHRLHPYHVQLHQELLYADFEKRVRFCNWAMNKIRRNEYFFNNILWSDESTFHKNGFVNRHNYHYYATENPHLLRQVDYQHRWSINVWGGIIGEYVIGPYFFEGHMNGAMYLNFLRNDLPGL